MKKFSLFSNYFFLIIAVSIFGLISCGDDPIFNNDIPPLASISADAEFDFGEPIILTISGEQGDTAMNLLTITEDGSTIDFSRKALQFLECIVTQLTFLI